MQFTHKQIERIRNVLPRGAILNAIALSAGKESDVDIKYFFNNVLYRTTMRGYKFGITREWIKITKERERNELLEREKMQQM